MKQLKIGNVLLENSYVLGPMAGVTDPAISLALQGAGSGSSVYGDGQCKRYFL
jgi:tRNA-dihydrouridine synthase